MIRFRSLAVVCLSCLVYAGLFVGCAPQGPTPTDEDECVAGSPIGESISVDLGGGVSMELVRIPAGCFMMGRESGAPIERPVHEVTISQDFYIGRYEVTRAQWQAVMETSPWAGRSAALEQGDSPATFVSWDNVVQFCETLSASTGYDIRLPSEAEWEYATRAGTTTKYSFGDDAGSLGSYAWYDDNVQDVGEEYAHPAGQKLPNPWGLYDVHGNVAEWCNDWYSSGYYDVSPSTDPPGASSGTRRVLRGGSWLLNLSLCRSAYRFWHPPGLSNDLIGFRCASGTP